MDDGDLVLCELAEGSMELNETEDYAVPQDIREVVEIVQQVKDSGLLPNESAIGLDAHGLSDLVDERSEEHTSELQSLMRISYAVFCLKKKTKQEPPSRHRQKY